MDRKSGLAKIFFVVSISISMLYAAPGETEGVMLVFPFGARQCAMGETGTALADDVSSLLFNPAGLARDNAMLKSGAISYSYTDILPKITKNIWHMNVATAYKPKRESIGGFGLNINMAHASENSFVIGPNFECVLSLSHSFNFKRWDIERHQFGFSFKFLMSRYNSLVNISEDYYYPDTNVAYTTLDTIPEFTGHSFAFDIGYIFDISSLFHLGFNMANIGPAMFLINKDDLKPLPFTLNFAFAYTDSFNFRNDRNLTLNSELRLEREFAKTYEYKKPDPFYKAIVTDFKDKTIRENMKKIQMHLGVELAFDEIIAVRLGYLLDKAGLRQELHWGLGSDFYDIFGIDFYMIVSPENSDNAGTRNNQWGITLSYYKIFQRIGSR